MTGPINLTASRIGATLIAAVLAGGPVLAGAGHDDGAGKQASFGRPGVAAQADRTIEIIMTDNRFSIPSLDVRAGETIRFVLQNDGKFLHEFALASPEMHQAHKGEMLEMIKSGALSMLGSKRVKAAAKVELASVGDAHASAGDVQAGMGDEHDDHHADEEAAHADNAVLVDPGDRAEFVWTFEQSDAELEFACTVPGHYEAGMVGPLRIGG